MMSCIDSKWAQAFCVPGSDVDPGNTHFLQRGDESARGHRRTLVSIEAASYSAPCEIQSAKPYSAKNPASSAQSTCQAAQLSGRSSSCAPWSGQQGREESVRLEESDAELCAIRGSSSLTSGRRENPDRIELDVSAHKAGRVRPSIPASPSMCLEMTHDRLAANS